MLQTILAEIHSGRVDSDLELISSAIRKRNKLSRSIAKLQKKAEFSVGDKVVFNSQVRPKYIAGHPATIKKINSVNIVVDLDEPVRRYSRNISTTPMYLEKV